MSKPATDAALADYRRDLAGRAQRARDFPPDTRVVAAAAVESVWATHQRTVAHALNHWRDLVVTAAVDRLVKRVEGEPAATDLAGSVTRDAVLYWLDTENPRVHDKEHQ